MNTKPKTAVEQLSRERIYRLFELAEEEFEKHPERSNRYVQLALKIGTRNRCRIPAELKTQYCKKCHCFLKKGKNCAIIEKENWVEIHCQNCNAEFKRKKMDCNAVGRF